LFIYVPEEAINSEFIIWNIEFSLNSTNEMVMMEVPAYKKASVPELSV
jgi:hypothetical protein